eukprot:Gb_34963 [translate_table: standard]
MALTPQLWSQKKKMLMFLDPVLQLHETRDTLTTHTKATTQISVLQGNHLGNANPNSGRDLITSCEQGQVKEALSMMHLMEYPEDSIYASLLQVLINIRALPEGKLVHAHMIQTGFKPDIFLDTKIVIMYAKCGSLVDARRVLDEMPYRNVVSWTVIIGAYARHGSGEEALKLFYQMQRTGIQPNHFTFTSVLPACANLAALKHGKEVHEVIIRSGFQSNVFVGSALVDMYVKCHSLENARQLFDKMAERNAVSWNAMIAGYVQNGHVDEALKLFQKMPERTVVSWTAMIAGYVQNGQVDEALKFFQEMPERNVVSWTAMVSGYAQNGNVDEALKLFQQMPERDAVAWNAMIAGYAQNGHVDEALKLFLEMPGKDVFSWNAMIAGYGQNGHFDEALELFRQMQLTGVKADSDTFASILSACANLAALEHGKDVHKIINRSGFESNVFVASALVDMYAKCGSIEIARQVFDKMPRRDVVSWNSMIVGYAIQGYGKEALQLFEQMRHSGIKPDHVTFVGILSACCHAGLVCDGWRYFNCMSRDYRITPAIEHYCCMVDLLGRAGHLDEAQDLINKMPLKPNVSVWGSLLGACRIHTNIKIGKYVAERLFELDPKNAAHYVLLSNMYAAAGRWDDVEKVREMMKERKVKKKPGCSWIEVKNKVYSFVVGDRSHPQMQKIYLELERLSVRMKEAGYVPDTNFVLHDVEEEQKEHILFHHSEKLAIVFGLINTSPGTPIRIIKNLRVCGDCHSATKLISKIVAREIVVRDAHRFHYFIDGQCSCGDYW